MPQHQYLLPSLKIISNNQENKITISRQRYYEEAHFFVSSHTIYSIILLIEQETEIPIEVQVSFYT